MAEKRRVIKKGKVVVTRKGNFVRKLAREIANGIRHYCRRAKIAGSIRRGEKNPVDIDIVLIPKNKEKIESFLRKKGKFIEGGEKKVVFKIKGVNVELYYTNKDEWGAALLAYSSETGASIGLRMFAKRKGFKLSQHGLFKNGKRIAGKTEKEIYEALGKKYKPASER